jgi:TatA/E family protein of Tat protein translocase
MDLGAPELLIILVIGLLVFGSSRLPKLARSLGQASKEFKSATTGDWLDITKSASPAAATPTTPAEPAEAAEAAEAPHVPDEPPSSPAHPAA